MIQQANLSVESQWQKELKQCFSRPEELLSFLQLPVNEFAEDIEARSLFNMRVPKPFAQLMEKGNPSDPLLLQVLPKRAEFIDKKEFILDPLLEHQSQLPGLLHKYKSRVLIMFRTGCAVNCRYCFRRHFPYNENHVNKNKLLEALKYVAADNKINEIILSGGDPLMADDDAIGWMFNEIAQIPHIKRVRIHTRLPVVIPSRITEKFMDILSEPSFKVIVVLHINHSNEISQELVAGCTKLLDKRISLFNQAVLLQSINDSVECQVQLSEALFNVGILPYYLHLLDKVKGTSHFDVPEDNVKQIYQGMLSELPGFLVPKLVREIGGETSKTPVLP